MSDNLVKSLRLSEREDVLLVARIAEQAE
jgi:14-3-3 protein epsilon